MVSWTTHDLLSLDWDRWNEYHGVHGVMNGALTQVLDALGYLDGDTVTPAGQRLSRLYSELALLAAECLRRGLWEGLDPAELAACVSVLTFESRQADDDTAPRLPGNATTKLRPSWPLEFPSPWG